MNFYTYVYYAEFPPVMVPAWHHWTGGKDREEVATMAALKFCRENRPKEGERLIVLIWDDETPTHRNGKPRKSDRFEFVARIERQLHATA